MGVNVKEADLEFFQDLLALYNQDDGAVPEGFETNFLCDLAERHARAEKGVIDPETQLETVFFISEKMLKILHRIGEERFGMDPGEYRDD